MMAWVCYGRAKAEIPVMTGISALQVLASRC